MKRLMVNSVGRFHSWVTIVFELAVISIFMAAGPAGV